MKKLTLTLLALLISAPAYAGGRQIDYTMDSGIVVTGAYAEITDLYYRSRGDSFYQYTFYKDYQSFIDGKSPIGYKRYYVPYSDVQSNFSALVDTLRTTLYAHSDSVLEIDTDADEVPDQSFFNGAVNLP